jgi:hypothetical protein
MLTETDLNTFIGTTGYYRYLAGLKLTDGVKYLADEAGAYWLLDIICSYQIDEKIRKLHFQVWELKLSPKDEATGRQRAVVTMKTDTNQPELVRQEIESGAMLS